MLRRTLVPVVLLGLAGCGGSSSDPPDQRPGPERRTLLRELRSPDARSPFVSAGTGAWRCRSGGRVQVSVSADGEVSITTPVMVLASVASRRTVVNRACERGAGGGGRDGALSGRVGATVVRCRAPETVRVDFAGGDVTLRAAGGRYLAGAAVRPDGIGVAGYWGAGCAPVESG
jgi:hypothetical protein